MAGLIAAYSADRKACGELARFIQASPRADVLSDADARQLRAAMTETATADAFESHSLFRRRGVTGLTICNWENGKARPMAKQLAAWGAVRRTGKREALRRLELLG